MRPSAPNPVPALLAIAVGALGSVVLTGTALALLELRDAPVPPAPAPAVGRHPCL